jgi:hypothetical protein
MADEPNQEFEGTEEESGAEAQETVQISVVSLHELSALESETLAAEIHLLGQLRDRISPAARYADKIPTRYRRLNHKTEGESEQTSFLGEGFPFSDGGKPLTGLLIIDKFASVQIEPGSQSSDGSGQYVGERLYLTHDRKWIITERVGAYSGALGSHSEWEASCRIVTDRSLLEHYSIETISDGLFNATNKLWEKLTPRMEALKKRAEKAHQVSSALANMKSLSQSSYGAGGKANAAKADAAKAAASAMTKVRLISRS